VALLGLTNPPFRSLQRHHPPPEKRTTYASSESPHAALPIVRLRQEYLSARAIGRTPYPCIGLSPDWLRKVFATLVDHLGLIASEAPSSAPASGDEPVPE
jgi:hypothetical protein